CRRWVCSCDCGAGCSATLRPEPPRSLPQRLRSRTATGRIIATRATIATAAAATVTATAIGTGQTAIAAIATASATATRAEMDRAIRAGMAGPEATVPATTRRETIATTLPVVDRKGRLDRAAALVAPPALEAVAAAAVASEPTPRGKT